MRPITFWSLVTFAMFAAMTALWVFGDEPTGALFVLSTVLFWGSGIALIFFGLVAISRRTRPSGTRGTQSTASRARRGPNRV
jgi:hypothetical protein